MILNISHTIPDLAYDGRTVRQLHHLGHHAAYTSQLNAVLEKMRWDPELKHLAKMGVDKLLQNLDSVPEGEW